MESKPKGSLREVFLNAAEIDDPVARSSFLKEACRGDAVFLQRVEGLLKAEAEAGLPQVEAPSSRIQDDARPGSRIGHYCLIEKIGEGGCGIVFLAEQEEPVRRQVALKIIKLGMDTHEVVARFEAERQALAIMDHPGIAQVFDAGATDAGISSWSGFADPELHIIAIKIGSPYASVWPCSFKSVRRCSTHTRRGLFIVILNHQTFW